MKRGCTDESGASRVGRQIWASFILYAFGVFLVYSAYGTLLSLQSSVNVVDGLGTTALSAIYGSAVIFSVLCVPGLIRKFGAKKCVCCSEITYFFYTVANFYPTFYTMLPASLIVGIGDGLLWACFPIMNSFFANRHSSVSDKNNGRADESRFSGYFFSIFQMSKIVGNLVSYAVLYGFNSQSKIHGNRNITEVNVTLAVTTDSTALYIDDLYYCGANDCQDADVVSDAIDHYVPANKWALFILLSLMAVLCITAVVLHIIFIPNDGIFGTSAGRGGNRSPEQKTTDKDSKAKLVQENEIDDEEEKGPNEMVLFPGKNEEAEETLNLNDEIKGNCLAFGISLAKDIGLQMIDVKQLLLMPMIFFVGLDYGFVTSELTRSYTSCVFGVSWVPIHAMFFGVGAAIMCYLTGKFSKKVPRKYLVGVAATVDVGFYIYCLLWTPSFNSHLSVIPMYLLIGGMQGIWVPVSQVLEVSIFPDRLDVCSPVWNFWFMLGIGTQFAWSTSLCVSTKIYVQIGFVCCSVVGYVLLERIRLRQPVREESADENF